MAIAISKLNKTYENGYQALKSISFDIADGDLVCLLGPSGCGKSTTLNIIAGLLDPTSGDISIDGHSIIHEHPKDRNIGMVFQDYALYPHMTVLENVTFPLRVGDHRKPKDEAEKIAHRYMAMTGIEELADKKPGAMSGGQQQRVAIARALVNDPKVLLLDEPLSNLDARLRLRIREEIRRLVKSTGITTVFVTHDQEEALSISDRIALMNQGVIQQYDVPQQLYLDPANLFVAKFLGSPIINLFELSYDQSAKALAGPTFSIPLDRLDRSRMREGLAKALASGPVTAGIRPEHFIVAEAGQTPDFTVKIDSVEMIGRYSVLHFDADGVHASSTVDARSPIRGGDSVGYVIDYDDIFLFDADGTRLY